ncbi:DUF2971 domain-containing protein [Photobacterium leiognathi]|uniref:DUF2971 domain-containing protein n=1 Tax=Photobacterium leiognathi TaxID=553611 RepID=UPI002982A288|nr:DUF2971 domain-containing protein [Photobacterium leiognathi]
MNNSLFKFRTFSQTSFDILNNQELWFALPKSLNDPFECLFDDDEVKKKLAKFPQMTEHRIEKIASDLRSTFESLGVCSFSRARKNQLMWSHYANEHRGFCIGFNKKLLLESHRNSIALDVNYQSEQPSIRKLFSGFEFNPVSNALEGNINHSVFSDIIRTKYTYWGYERETRILLPQSCALKFPHKAIRSVALGLRAEGPEVETLLEILKQKQWKHVKVYQAEKVKGQFALRFNEIKI